MIDPRLTEILVTRPPAFDAPAAARVLAEQYGLAGHLEPLFAERDRNFRVDCDDGRRFVLKLSNSAESREVTRFHTGVLRHLEDTDPELPVPRIVPTQKGNDWAVARATDGRRHAVRLLTWLDGEPLGERRVSGRLAEAMGGCLARLDAALSGCTLSAPPRWLVWDMRYAGELRHLLGHVRDRPLRVRCEQILERFVDVIEPQTAGLRRQIVFNDMHSDNVLVDPGDADCLTGIIDFGDVVRAPLVFDVAIAVSYLLGEGRDLLRHAPRFVRAFHEVTPLVREELSLLPDLVATRMVSTVLIGNWRASRHPDNRKYILRSEPAASRRLDRLEAMGADRFTLRLLEACGY